MIAFPYLREGFLLSLSLNKKAFFKVDGLLNYCIRMELKVPVRIESGAWMLSRRDFVKSSLLAASFTQLPWMLSCSGKSPFQPLKEKQFRILERATDILFPQDELGPGAIELQSPQYILWVLRDELIDPDENEFIINGIDLIDEASRKKFGSRYVSLSVIESEQLIELLSKEKWARSWFSVMLTLIFESMFADPVYGSNPDGIGWKWLNHNPGVPRPDYKIAYPNIFVNV